MKRRRVYLLLFLAGAVALSLAGPSIYTYFVAERFSGALAQAIQAAAATKEPSLGRVDLTRLPAPSWDALHIFGPYTPTEQIQADLGFAWREREASRLARSESENLLVLVKARSVTMAVLFPRKLGDFAPEARRRKFLPAEAVFAVRKGDWAPLLQPAARAREMRGPE